MRLHEWVRRLNLVCAIHSYAGLPTSSPRQMLKHPIAVTRAEASLRALAAMPHECVFLLREASPLSRGALEKRLLRSADFSVYDFDDALQWDWGGSNGFYRKLAPKGPKTIAAVQAADRVIAGNGILADWASGFNEDVVVIPTCVDPLDYEQKTDYIIADPPRIGWIGSPNNEDHLLPIAEPLLDLHRRTGARLTIVSGIGASHLRPLEAMIDRVPWSPSTQYSVLRTFDIGIMPLPDSLYERGKCGYKLLQYAAAGVPAVGSPVGVNEEILAACGMAAPSKIPDWSDAIQYALLLAPEARRDLAERASRAVCVGYSYDAWQDRWHDALFRRL